MTVVSMRKRRIKRLRRRLPSKRRKIRAKSLFPKRTVIIHKGDVSIYKIRGPLPRLFRKFRAPMHFWRNFINFVVYMGKVARTWKRPQSKTWKPISWKKKETYPIRWARKKTAWSVHRKWDPFKKKPRKHITSTKFKGHVKKKTKFEPYIKMPRFGKKGFVYDWRGGARDMSGRIYKNYGPYPKELGPDLIFDIIPTHRLKEEIGKAAASGRNIDYLRKAIKESLDELREKLIEHGKKIIKRIVPKETGDLQNSMIDSLLESKRMGYRLKMEISAKVDWAGVANKMPTRKVRHSGKSGQIGRRSGQILYDPKAETDSYKTTVLFLKKRATKLIKEMIDRLTINLLRRTRTRAWRRPSIRTKGAIMPSGDVYEKTISHVSKKEELRAKYIRGYIPKVTFTRQIITPIEPHIVRPMTQEERQDTREVRMRKLWGRISQEKTKNQVNFSKDLIEGWFKIKGLDI